MDQLLEQRLKENSFYARGIYLVKMKASANEEGRDFTGKAADLMECMVDAGALTQTAAALALRCNRQEASRAAKSLWFAGMMDMFSVFSQDISGTTNAQFQLWVVKGCQPPSDAKEACRLAILGLFYGHAKIEMSGFGWRLVRRRGQPVMAEVSFANKDGEAVKWLIDTPRLGEEPMPEADLFIHPDREDAEQKTPAGKRYTWDLAVVGARPEELRKAVRLKK